MTAAIGLILAPALFGLVCLALPRPWWRAACMLVGAWTHLGVVVWSWREPQEPAGGEFMGVDPLGHLFVTLISVLFAAAALHFVGYHRRALLSERIFVACILGLLSTLSAVCVSQNLGMLWVAIETSTLAAAPLIYFHLGARALEATWKFLLMNSVGIALALLGVFCTALASAGAGEDISLTISDLVRRGTQLDAGWVRAGFLLVVVGYGTKMGLAPLHSWLPDAHGEAPATISALLSGAVLHAAFLGILRTYQVCDAAGLAAFAGRWLIALGLLSMAVAAVFVVGQRHFKRLLAYSSIEHMGILAVGAGLGSAASYSVMLHVFHNILYKGSLFFIAGLLGHLYGSYLIADIRGTLHRYPYSGILLLAGLFAIVGLPPFGLFYSELGVLFAAAKTGHWWVLGAFSVFLCIVFVGMVTAVLPMAFGEPNEPPDSPDRPDRLERWRHVVMATSAAALMITGLMVALYQPIPMRNVLEQAAAALTSAPTWSRVAASTPQEVVP